MTGGSSPISATGFHFPTTLRVSSFEALRSPSGPAFGWLHEAAGSGARSGNASGLVRLGVWIGYQLPAGQRRRAGGILHQPAEHKPAGAGAASVEAEAELFQIGLQMVGPDAALMCAQ